MSVVQRDREAFRVVPLVLDRRNEFPELGHLAVRLHRILVIVPSKKKAGTGIILP